MNPTEPIVVNIKVGGSVENPADKAPEAAVNEVIPQENLVIEGGEEPVEQAVTSDVKKAGPGAPKEEDTPVSSPTSSEVESSSEEEEEDYDEYDDEEIVEDDAGMTELQKKILGVKPIMEAGASECTKEEYVQFKGDLIRYHCVRFGCKDCDNARVPGMYNKAGIYIARNYMCANKPLLIIKPLLTSKPLLAIKHPPHFWTLDTFPGKSECKYYSFSLEFP